MAQQMTPRPTREPELMSIRDSAKTLNVSTRTVNRLCLEQGQGRTRGLPAAHQQACVARLRKARLVAYKRSFDREAGPSTEFTMVWASPLCPMLVLGERAGLVPCVHHACCARARKEARGAQTAHSPLSSIPARRVASSSGASRKPLSSHSRKTPYMPPA